MSLETHRLTPEGGPATLLARMPGAHTAVVAVSVGAGPAIEREDENGISHFLEHLVLSGTASHPSEEAFQSAVDSLGGYVQGLTHKEYTEYSFVCGYDRYSGGDDSLIYYEVWCDGEPRTGCSSVGGAGTALGASLSLASLVALGLLAARRRRPRG